MPSWKISNDKVFIGEGALSQLDSILPGYKNILLFNDKNSFHPCGAADYFNKKFLRGGQNQSVSGPVDRLDDRQAQLGNPLIMMPRPHPETNENQHQRFAQHIGSPRRGAPGRRRQDIQYVSYAGKALPIEDVEEKYREVKNNSGVDLIIAVGGGTIIDIAKIISIAYSNQCETVEEILSDKALENRLDLIFIPTTAGTGSEATSFAVLYKDKIKLSIDHKSLLPRYIILDPFLLRSLPVPILYSTVLDALAQAIESIWARGSTDESKECSKKAIGLILDNLNRENTIERLSQFQLASHLAGKAINISRTTLPHSISYPVTSHFGVPHGIAVFLTLPKVAELNYCTTRDKVGEGVQMPRIKRSFSMLFTLFGVDGIEQLKGKLIQVMVTLGFSTRLRDYGIKRKDLSFLADNALTKGRSDNNPRQVGRDEVLRLLEEIF